MSDCEKKVEDKYRRVCRRGTFFNDEFGSLKESANIAYVISGKSVNDDTNRNSYDLSTEMIEAGSIKNQRLTGEVLFSMKKITR